MIVIPKLRSITTKPKGAVLRLRKHEIEVARLISKNPKAKQSIIQYLQSIGNLKFDVDRCDINSVLKSIANSGYYLQEVKEIDGDLGSEIASKDWDLRWDTGRVVNEECKCGASVGAEPMSDIEIRELKDINDDVLARLRELETATNTPSDAFRRRSRIASIIRKVEESKKDSSECELTGLLRTIHDIGSDAYIIDSAKLDEPSIIDEVMWDYMERLGKFYSARCKCSKEFKGFLALDGCASREGDQR